MLKEIVKYPLNIKGVESKEYTEIKSPYSGEVIAAVAQALHPEVAVVVGGQGAQG